MRILLAPVLVAGLGLLLATGEGYAQVNPCTEGCIGVSVESPGGGPFGSGETFQTKVSYQQGAADKGLDNEAAIAFSLGLPSLSLADCSNPTADGLTAAIVPDPAIAGQFRVVVENTVCTDDSKPCLCPGTGQSKAQYMNVVIFGPLNLPTPGSGDVTFPVLPNGTLVTLSLKVDAPTSTPLTLHVFNETDNQGTTPKPQFGALCSVGDTTAVDDSVNRPANTSNIAFTDGLVNVKTTTGCLGDCDGNCEVGIGELQIGLNIFFGAPIALCPAFDPNNTGGVGIGQLQIGLNNFFGGCPQPCTPSN